MHFTKVFSVLISALFQMIILLYSINSFNTSFIRLVSVIVINQDEVINVIFNNK